MDCYQIEWQGPYSFDEAERRATLDLGIYMECIGKRPRGVQYVGHSRDISKRLRDQRLAITRHGSKGRSQVFDFLGEIKPFEGSELTRDSLLDIESFLMNTLRLQHKLVGNDPQTTKQYRKKQILVINIGKIGPLDKVMCHDERLLQSLKKNLKTKPQRSDDW